MRMIIGGSLMTLNPSRTLAGGPPTRDGRRSDDNSRRKVQNLRVDSSAERRTSAPTPTERSEGWWRRRELCPKAEARSAAGGAPNIGADTEPSEARVGGGGGSCA